MISPNSFCIRLAEVLSDLVIFGTTFSFLWSAAAGLALAPLLLICNTVL